MVRKAKNEEVQELNEGDAIRMIMKEKGVVQVDLADRLGILQSGLSGNINRKRMSIEFFRNAMNAMGCDVAVIDRESGEVMCKVGGK